MPAPFSSHERDRIGKKLVEDARTLLPIVGLKKLPIETLTQKAGISKGAFYAFFDSKEALYAQVLAHEGPMITERVLPPLHDESLSKRAAFTQFLHRVMNEYQTNPVLRRIVENPEELAAINTRLGAERVSALAAPGFKPLLDFLHQVQGSGEMTSDSADAVLGLIVVLPHLSLHQNIAGVRDWPATCNLLIDLVAKGLFTDDSMPSTTRDST